MAFFINHFVQIWLLPPTNFLLFAFIGLIVWQYWPRAGKSIILLSLVGLWLFSTPFVAQKLIDPLQYHYPILSINKLVSDKKAAIVILEGGLQMTTPEYGNQPMVGDETLARIRYGAFLHQKIGAGMLVSGNDPSNPAINQTDYMANALRDYFNMSTQWREDRGYNTATEGIYTIEILKKAGIKRIYLVTSAFHMPRAMLAFKNKKIEVIPAPTAYVGFEKIFGKISAFFPATGYLMVSGIALREYIGLAWYRSSSII